MVIPAIQPTAVTPTQQSPMPLTQWCHCDNEDFSLVINDLTKACNCMQQRWPTVTTTTAPHSHPTAPGLNQPTTDSDLLDTLASLAEFIHSEMDEQLDDQPPIPDIHQLAMSFNNMRILQTNVMVKLIDMIGDLNNKIDLLIAATTCPQKSPLQSTTTNHMIPVPQLLLFGKLLFPQQYTATGPLKPKGPLETLRNSILRTQLAPVSHMCTYKSVIPAKPPFHRDCNPLTMLRTKDSIRPP